jgi:hypothetical protein
LGYSHLPLCPAFDPAFLGLFGLLALQCGELRLKHFDLGLNKFLLLFLLIRAADCSPRFNC